MSPGYSHERRTVPNRQISGHPGPFGCDVRTLGLTSQALISFDAR